MGRQIESSTPRNRVYISVDRVTVRKAWRDKKPAQTLSLAAVSHKQ